jgi:hypothetical protein
MRRAGVRCFTAPFPSFENNRYRIMKFSENIKSGGILQVRLLIRFNTAIADELR